ncbi:MarR family winged helix-turn-helix transcriptional regulator [Aneurinibacillus sp. REN35]|uniref:MarR family winged helix-turn-helix transcriptional regulator n=1 Tax=Aneurinibacillus sp. REN35 TaxID=3237286 RepID=UPI0035284F2B
MAVQTKDLEMDNTDIFHLLHTMQIFTNHAAIKWTKAFNQEIGISPLIVLSKLKHHGRLKQSELANKLGLTPGAITNIADKLIKKSYVVREFNTDDRRVVYLVITDEGRKILDKAIEASNEIQLEIFQAISKSEQKQLLQIYQKLIAQFT